jgi:RNA polymerase sigma factor (sigma-70 family)
MLTSANLHHLVGQLRRRAETLVPDSSDAELLRRVREGDATAFESIVARHGGGVLGVCRKVLPSQADAEDVFQATFLVLWRSASAIRCGQALGGWLRGVAHRLALKAVIRSARRQRTEQQRPAPTMTTPDLSWREACAILHEELDRLPEDYRLPLLLCYLDGKTRDEAAREIGCKLDVLRGRLERGRDRLRSRLSRRGVSLSAGLLAALHGSTEVGGPTSLLIQATVRAITTGRASAAVTALACGGASAMFNAKIKLFVALIVLTAVIAGVVASRSPTSAAARPSAPAETERKAEAPANAPEAEPAKDNEPMTVAGRVVDPAGKPVAGAKLFVPRLKKNPPNQPEDIGVEEVGASDADGRFTVTVKRPDGFPRTYLIAHADGFGVDWIDFEKGKPDGDVLLRLVKDQPISGRLLDTEGKPLAGVAVGIRAIYVPDGEKLDDYLSAWKKSWRETIYTPVKRLYLPLAAVTGTATTDRNGQFRLSGAGVERIVHLSVQGRGVTGRTLYVLTRAGLDPKAYNEAAGNQEPPEFRARAGVPVLHGPEATFIIEAGRVVEGQVRDQATGKPLAGCRVHASFGFGEGVQDVTDADGKYHLEGLPQTKDYHVFVGAPKGSVYLNRTAVAEAPPGAAPVRIDVDLARGVRVTGRVIDRQTGKGVQSGIRFAPLPDNSYYGKPGFDAYRHDRTMQATDADGRFQVTTIPGKSLLMVQTHGRDTVDGLEVCPYLTARPDPDYKDLFRYDKDDNAWLFTSAGGGLEFLNIENVVKVVDLKEDGGPVQVDLHVERGRTAKIVVQDAEGKPLPGVIASGLTAHWPITVSLKSMDAPVTVYALDPEQPRRLVLLHPEKKLGGTVTLRGDEKEPVVVKLAPLGTLKGRFVEIDGTPLVGAELSLYSPDGIIREMYRYLAPRSSAVKTDAEGRFTLPDVLPGVPIGIQTHKGMTYYVGEPRIGTRQVEPGQTFDLGERKLKPQN